MVVVLVGWGKVYGFWEDKIEGEIGNGGPRMKAGQGEEAGIGDGNDGWWLVGRGVFFFLFF